jgi:hypothetical protein
MMRFAGLSIVFILAVSAAQTGAQPQANAPATQNRSVPTENSSERPAAAQPPTVDDICRALEEDAAENELPVEFFARVIWQESRFNARAVSRAGAQGIAQFMPRTADWRGLTDPFDPIGALRHSASYLRDLRNRFGNLGLAAAGYNAGPGRVSEWLAGRRTLPSETRNYVATVTGDGRRMGLVLAAGDCGNHDPAGAAVHPARQSHPGAERGGAAHRRLCAALGRATDFQLVGEPGLGDLSRPACLADR